MRAWPGRSNGSAATRFARPVESEKTGEPGGVSAPKERRETARSSRGLRRPARPHYPVYYFGNVRSGGTSSTLRGGGSRGRAGSRGSRSRALGGGRSGRSSGSRALGGGRSGRSSGSRALG